MNATVYRDGCGTYLGLRIHQANGEDICSLCQSEEDFRRLAHEGIPRRPEPALTPITPEEGERNRAVLAAAVRDMDRKARAS